MPRPPPRSTLFPYTTLFRSAPITPGATPTATSPLTLMPLRLSRCSVGHGGSLGPLHGCVAGISITTRSEEHTSELQSQSNLVCRLLLEKKKKNETPPPRNAA